MSNERQGLDFKSGSAGSGQAPRVGQHTQLLLLLTSNAAGPCSLVCSAETATLLGRPTKLPLPSPNAWLPFFAFIFSCPNLRPFRHCFGPLSGRVDEQDDWGATTVRPAQRTERDTRPCFLFSLPLADRPHHHLNQAASLSLSPPPSSSPRSTDLR
ncbi:hypothetical protein BT67DRAFT_161590 [Trichocladium antarcticum]|uniref:Uncharacterized protein n=1 Tax=Trichocladium antarcticum TaxID=1450529 RepID=A0AAN6UDP9_9PEZI|nr:hypothetical protein BT67DRAFT_161590 [Trichocladium antarcticum]